MTDRYEVVYIMIYRAGATTFGDLEIMTPTPEFKSTH